MAWSLETVKVQTNKHLCKHSSQGHSHLPTGYLLSRFHIWMFQDLKRCCDRLCSVFSFSHLTGLHNPQSHCVSLLENVKTVTLIRDKSIWDRLHISGLSRCWAPAPLITLNTVLWHNIVFINFSEVLKFHIF